jgi:hypothetical protein
MSWPSDTGVTSYSLYRGTQADLPNLLTTNPNTCTEYFGIANYFSTINEDPSGAAGGFYWYLVTGTNASGEGSAGSATAGIRSVHSSGECL